MENIVKAGPLNLIHAEKKCRRFFGKKFLIIAAAFQTVTPSFMWGNAVYYLLDVSTLGLCLRQGRFYFFFQTIQKTTV